MSALDVGRHGVSAFRVLTVQLLARRLGVSAATVNGWAAQGCPCERDEEDGRLYFDQAEVDRWREGGQRSLFAERA